MWSWQTEQKFSPARNWSSEDSSRLTQVRLIGDIRDEGGFLPFFSIVNEWFNSEVHLFISWLTSLMNGKFDLKPLKARKEVKFCKVLCEIVETSFETSVNGKGANMLSSHRNAGNILSWCFILSAHGCNRDSLIRFLQRSKAISWGKTQLCHH